MEPNIHVAITRRVKPGYEDAFEKAIKRFFAETAELPGVLGAQLIRPIPGSSSNTYGILRSFAGENERDAFYRSDTFREWQEVVAPMVEEHYRRTSLHGLEAFFADPTVATHPPRWKMAIVTWLGVWPTVFIVSQILAPYLKPVPSWASTACVTLLVVMALTWIVMPVLTKILRPWLRPKPVEHPAARNNP